MASLQGSPYFGSFADRANAWGQRLADLDSGLLGLQAVQRRWVYLEPIFGRGSGGLAVNEASRFARVDADFRQLLTGIVQDTRVVSFVNGRRGNELRDQLASMQDQLTRCQRALTEFLEEKRNLFPRFYFLGDDDLLEVLGQASNQQVIQTHLRKLFQAVHRVQFSEKGGSNTIAAICDGGGEKIVLKRPVAVASEAVGRWLERLAEEMRSTLAGLLTEALVEKVDPAAFPGQVLALREGIQFAAKVEKAIQTGHLPQLQKELQVDRLRVLLLLYISSSLSRKC